MSDVSAPCDRSADELDDDADKLEIEVTRLRQLASRKRRTPTAVVQWLDATAVEREYGLSMSTITSAARRGELTIGRAGRSPRVKRSDLDSWIATRRHPLSRPAAAGDSKADVEAQYNALTSSRAS